MAEKGTPRAAEAARFSAMKPLTGLRAMFHGETPGMPHIAHANGDPRDVTRLGSKFLIPVPEIGSESKPVRLPQEILTRQELQSGTEGLFKNYKKVFGETYTGGSSPKSFIGMAIEMSINNPLDEKEGPKWEVHHSPVENGTKGDYVRIKRISHAYNGFNEVQEISFITPSGSNSNTQPLVTFSSHLYHRDSEGKPGPQEKLEMFSPENNSYESLVRASQLMQDFVEIASTPWDYVSFRTLASRNEVVTHQQIQSRNIQHMHDLVAKEGAQTLVERPALRIRKPEDRITTREVLIKEAKEAGEKVDEVPLAEAYSAAYARIEADRINGPREHTVYDSGTSHMTKLDEDRERHLAVARQYQAQAPFRALARDLGLEVYQKLPNAKKTR